MTRNTAPIRHLHIHTLFAAKRAAPDYCAFLTLAVDQEVELETLMGFVRAWSVSHEVRVGHQSAMWMQQRKAGRKAGRKADQ